MNNRHEVEHGQIKELNGMTRGRFTKENVQESLCGLEMRKAS